MINVYVKRVLKDKEDIVLQCVTKMKNGNMKSVYVNKDII